MRKITQDKVSTMMEMRATGASMEAIASAIGTTIRSVGRHLRKNGIKTSTKRRPVRPKAAISITPADVDIMVEMRLGAARIREIAHRIGCAECTVRDHLDKSGRIPHLREIQIRNGMQANAATNQDHRAIVMQMRKDAEKMKYEYSLLPSTMTW